MPRNIIDKLAWWISNKNKREQFRYDINKTVIDSFVNNQEEFISKYPDLYDDINKAVVDSFINNQEEFISKYPDLYDDINKTVIDSFVNNQEEFKSKYPLLYTKLINTFENEDDYTLPEGCKLLKNHLGLIYEQYKLNTEKNKKIKVLEIGSRMLPNSFCKKDLFPNSEYIGFDYYKGDNVDIVGDAHQLSSYFNKDEKFDIIFSIAVFEHLAMPWKVAEEISKLLKINGVVYIDTHFSFPVHERPWHFFHFTDLGLKVLFSEALGFECIEAAFKNPIIGKFTNISDKPLINTKITGLFANSIYYGKKVKEVKDFNWNNVTVDELVSNTKYPKPTNS